MGLVIPLSEAHKVRVLDAACRNDFASFVRASFHTLAPNAEYLMNWHILAVAYHLELVRRGKIRRLIITLPPRSLKSIMASVALPAFVLGHDPSKRIIALSYGSELAVKLGNDFRAVVNMPWYRRQFSAMQIAGKNTELEISTTQRGFRFATSFEGGLTGRGGDIIIIDDPLKPSDAHSDSRRTGVNNLFYNTVYSRLDDKRSGAIIVVMQRLHTDDLVGMLLRTSNDWTVLSLPAIAQEDECIRISEHRYHQRRRGEALHPELAPLALLQAERLQYGSDLFAAQYQQAPVPPDGLMIKPEWIQYYDLRPERTPSSEVIQSWDTANKDGGQNDSSVCTTWLIHEGNYYLIDVLRDRWIYPDLKAKAIAHAREHDPDRILVEDTGVGMALVGQLKEAKFSAIAVKPTRDKKVRMSVQSAKFEAGRVFFPKNAPWRADLEAELLGFPHVRHDDQVDSCAQALSHEGTAKLWGAKATAGLNSVYRGLGEQLGAVPDRRTYEAMGIGGIGAYILGLTR